MYYVLRQDLCVALTGLEFTEISLPHPQPYKSFDGRLQPLREGGQME